MIACGREFTVVATRGSEPKLFAWGQGEDGQLGNGPQVPRLLPELRPRESALRCQESGKNHPKRHTVAQHFHVHHLLKCPDSVAHTLSTFRKALHPKHRRKHLRSGSTLAICAAAPLYNQRKLGKPQIMRF